MLPKRPQPLKYCLAALLAAGLSSSRASATASEKTVCASAADQAEAGSRIPQSFLSAIARVEAGRVDPASGALVAWPWTIDVGGTGTFFASKAEAVAAVRALQARGVTSIDVGCLQVNLAQHPEAFASLEQAFDPLTNARFAAGFLSSLFAQTGSWPLAAAAYHSQTPALGSDYQRRVLAEWAVPEGQTGRYGLHAARSQTGTSGHPGEMEQPKTADLAGGNPGPAFGRAELTSPRVTTPAPGGGMSWPATGRGLAAYRSMPVHLASAPPHPPAS